MLLDVEVLLEAIPALMEAEKALVDKGNRDLVAMAQADAMFAMGMQNPDVMEGGFKKFHDITAGFEDDMINIALKFRDGTINNAEALRRFKAMVGDRYQKMFLAGTEAVGNPQYSRVGLTKKDMAFINKARRAEMKYFRRFLYDINDPKHLPFNRIPKDAMGRALPGYRIQRHSYVSRAKYYANSGKAQFYNGMVAGAGSQMNIKWVLGVPQTEHCPVCPIYAKKIYTWKNLPTVPRGGDTPCLFKCYCHLEFVPKATGKTFDIPGAIAQAGQGTVQGLTAPGRWARATNFAGEPVSPNDAFMLDLLYSNMNKARQMIALGVDKKYWIGLRKDFNARIIDYAKTRGLRVTPTTSVKDLVATIKDANKFKGKLIALREPEEYALLSHGDEVVMVRGDFSSAGVIKVAPDGRRFFIDSDGKEILLDYGKDIFFVVKKNEVTFSASVEAESAKILECFNVTKCEHLSAIDKNGKVLLTAIKGTRGQVKLSKEQAKIILDNAECVIHNHPSSSSFSYPDIVTSSALRVKYSIVVSKEHIYKAVPDLENPNCPWGKSDFTIISFRSKCEVFDSKIRPKYRKRIDKEIEIYKEKYSKGEINAYELAKMEDKITLKHTHDYSEEMMKFIVDNFGFKYEKIPVAESGWNLPQVIESIIKEQKGEPVTTYTNPFTLSDPIKYKNIYLRHMFGGDKELYKFFVSLWKKAKEENAFFPINIAWIRFREVYKETDDGEWEKR